MSGSSPSLSSLNRAPVCFGTPAPLRTRSLRAVGGVPGQLSSREECADLGVAARAGLPTEFQVLHNGTEWLACCVRARVPIIHRGRNVYPSSVVVTRIPALDAHLQRLHRA